MTQSDSHTHDSKDRSGSSIGPYQLTRLMGRGGMGEVYEATDTRLDRVIAIKLLRPEVVQDEARKARFEREAKALAALKHPGIVTIYSIEDIDDLTLITMDLVKGKTLSEILKTQSTMSVDEVLDISRQVAEALAIAHKQGIVHRDIKPDNIIVGDDGQVTVLDFGLAKLAASPDANSTPDDIQTKVVGETVEGRILGTVHYMSPEQAQGLEIAASTDVFSFGVVLYEMSTGTSPFEGETTLSRLSSLLKDDPTKMQSHNKAVPQAMSRVVKRCLMKDPDRRYQTAMDVRNELDLITEARAQGLDGEYASNATAKSASPVRQLVTLAFIIGVAALAYWFGGKNNTLNPLANSTNQSTSPENAVSIMAPEGFDVLDAQISPDGRTIAMRTIKSNADYASATHKSEDTFYHIRPLDQFQSTLVKSSSRSVEGRFSPDGTVFLFLTNAGSGAKPIRVMRKEMTADVPPAQITSVSPDYIGYLSDSNNTPRGFCWLSNSSFVVTSQDPPIAIMFDARSGSELERVELSFAEEQRPIRLLEAIDEETILLCTDRYAEGRYLQELFWANITTGETGLILKNTSEARLANDDTLLFTRGETLYKIGFNRESKTTMGSELPVLTKFRTVTTWTSAAFSLSDNGTIAFLHGGIQGASRSLWKTDVTGKHIEQPFPRDAYEEGIAVSGDGQTTLVTTTDIASGMWSIDRGTLKPTRFRPQLSFPDKDAFMPVISQNAKIGLAMTHSSHPTRESAIIQFDPSGSAAPKKILESKTHFLNPLALNPNTNEVLFNRNHFGKSSGTLNIVDLNNDNEPKTLLDDVAEYSSASFSPDGRLLAFTSVLAGLSEALVAQFDSDGLSGITSALPYQVSAVGWTDEGGGLVSLRMISDNKEYIRSVSTRGDSIVLGDIEETGRILDNQTIYATFDAAGNVYSVRKGENEKPTSNVQLITNWVNSLD